jgi:ABC-2 type transport system permease protein
VISQALFFASPVIILVEDIQKKAPGVVRYYLFNPLAALLQQARHWMIGTGAVKGHAPVGYGPAAYMGGREWLLVPGLILLAALALGYWVFRREAPRIAEEL